jgi:hypothetical protein
MKKICIYFLPLLIAFNVQTEESNEKDYKYLICRPDTFFKNSLSDPDNIFIRFFERENTSGINEYYSDPAYRKDGEYRSGKGIQVDLFRKYLTEFISKEERARALLMQSFFAEETIETYEARESERSTSLNQRMIGRTIFTLNRKSLKLRSVISTAPILSKKEDYEDTQCELLQKNDFQRNFKEATEENKRYNEKIRKQHQEDLKI